MGWRRTISSGRCSMLNRFDHNATGSTGGLSSESWNDEEREEVERGPAAEGADEFLVTGSGADADVDLVDALDGKRSEAGVEDLGVGAGEWLGNARERFGRGCGGALGNLGRDGAEADGVHVDDLTGVDRSHKGPRPVLTGDCTGSGNLNRGERRYRLGEIERCVLAGRFGLDAYEAAIGLDVPRNDNAHAFGCELRHRDFALADPHRDVAEPGIERDRPVNHGVRQAGPGEGQGKARSNGPVEKIEVRCVSDEFNLRAVVHVDLEEAAVAGCGVDDFSIAGNRGFGDIRRSEERRVG